METASPMVGVGQRAMNIEMGIQSAPGNLTCRMTAWATVLHRSLSLASAVLGVAPHR